LRILQIQGAKGEAIVNYCGLLAIPPYGVAGIGDAAFLLRRIFSTFLIGKQLGVLALWWITIPMISKIIIS